MHAVGGGAGGGAGADALLGMLGRERDALGEALLLRLEAPAPPPPPPSY